MRFWDALAIVPLITLEKLAAQEKAKRKEQSGKRKTQDSFSHEFSRVFFLLLAFCSMLLAI